MFINENLDFINMFNHVSPAWHDYNNFHERINKIIIGCRNVYEFNSCKSSMEMLEEVYKVPAGYNSLHKIIARHGLAILDNKYINQILAFSLKGIYAPSQYFQLKLNQHNCLVKIMEYASDKNKWIWSIRFDRPHNNVPFPHININPRVTDWPDPHTAISNTTLQVAKKTAEVSKDFYQIEALLPFVIDAAYLSWHVYKDYQRGTVRNSITATSTVAGSWAGAFAGAKLGGTLGSLIWPGVGTVTCSFIFGIGGAIYGGFGCKELSKNVLDQWKIGIENNSCRLCKKDFSCKKYNGQSVDFCIPCDYLVKLKFLYDFNNQFNSSFDICNKALATYYGFHFSKESGFSYNFLKYKTFYN